MATPRLAALFAIFAVFLVASVEMRDPLAVTISRMKRMQQQDKDGEGAADLMAPQWAPPPRLATGYDGDDFVLRRYLKRAAILDRFAVPSDKREDWMTRLG